MRVCAPEAEDHWGCPVSVSSAPAGTTTIAGVAEQSNRAARIRIRFLHIANTATLLIPGSRHV
ncbi:hypothetical protein GCM10012275_64530 [Longimycelium tulufanense]|uniref:Uncharacterized protein n=1 Tax=Longimycelium tulufanense TaxID=907463 RepID=A0A8J3CL09_9PSEU|nr:hypothetical protein GCM10012275_64530 [Longimycelium tulufanense]